MKQNPVRLSIALIGMALAYFSFSSFGDGVAMSWDAFGYYYYLPLTFLQDSMIIESLAEVKPIFDQYNPSSTIYQFTPTEGGKYIVLYTMGQALLYLPFFLLGHVAALIFGYSPDGFAAPYDFAIRLGGVIYHTAGFYFIGRLLLKKYNQKIVALTLIVLFFGTNALLTLQLPLNAHGSLIFLLSLVFYFTDKYFEHKNLGSLMIVAVAFGIACLSRPTDIIAIIPIVLWPWISGKDFKAEWNKLLTDHKKDLILGVSAVGIIGSLQMIYWKHAGGSFIIDSYSNAAEGLDFLSPHTVPFLFGFKVGWFVYTPLMILVVIYLVAKIIKGDKAMIVIGLYLALFIYLASSWTNYWYGGSFSQRAMVQSYVLLSFVLCGLLNWVASYKPSALRGLGFGIIGLLCVLNLWQSFQFTRSVFKPDTMTKEYYFAAFFDGQFDPSKSHLLSIDRYYFQLNPVQNVPDGYYLFKTLQYPLPENGNLEDVDWTVALEKEYQELCPSDHCWLRMQVEMVEPLKNELILAINFYNKDGGYHHQLYDIQQGEPSKIDQFYITPNVRNQEDKMKTFIWNRSKTVATVKKASLKVYAPIND